MNDEAEARELLRRFLVEYDAAYHKPRDTPNRWDALQQIRLEVLDAPLELRREIVRELPAAITWSEENVMQNSQLKHLWKDYLLQETYVELPELAATNYLNFVFLWCYDSWGRPRRKEPERYELTHRFYRASPRTLVHLKEQLPARLAALGLVNHIHSLGIEKHFFEVTAHLNVNTLPGNSEEAAAVIIGAFTAFWEALDEKERGYSGFSRESAGGQLFLVQSPEVGGALRHKILELLVHEHTCKGTSHDLKETHQRLLRVLGWLYQTPPTLSEKEIRLHFELTEFRYSLIPFARLYAEATALGIILPAKVIAAVRRAHPEGLPRPENETEAARLDALFDGAPELNFGEPWAEKALADLNTLAVDTRKLWRALLEHRARLDASKPTKGWNKKAELLLSHLNTETLLSWLPSWFLLTGKLHTFSRDKIHVGFDAYNEPILRGLVWNLALLPPSRQSAKALAHLVQVSLGKISGVGPHSRKTATAAIYALGQLGDAHALIQLARLHARVSFKPALKEVEKALDAVAAKTGLSREDLDELSVPTFGLNERGVRSETLGDTTAELHLSDKNVVLTWRNAAGKALKSPPAAVKRDFTEELKELKAAQKDAAQALSTIAARLDNLFLAQKSWLLEVWRERYLEHPLVGTVARRLIWVINGQSVGVTEAGFEDVNGEVQAFSDDAVVKLWHPLEHEPDVMAWREWLAERHLTQPFKQAHREVYRLTGAEEQTRVYSNRFAAHILKQHQFNALCALRGWRNTLRLDVDHEAPPATLALPLWSLRAEFWVESVVSEHGSETTETGTFLYLSTDQVRFYPANAGENSAHMAGGPYHLHYHSDAPVEPVPLTELPPLVFSEVMRDVDLFVGVTSVANDPLWFDRADEHGDYWQTTSFGDLSATAETRKALLADLLPRLSLRDSCRLESRFLVVQGVLRTYRVHLGSTNILMEPENQYLCIVPNRGFGWSGDGVFLPFEGDSALSIILSKAFMLADDTSITDPLIVSQIRR